MDNDLYTLFGNSSDETVFGGYTSENIEETKSLIKAMQAQEGVTDISQLTGGGAIQPQSLETTLVMLTWQEKHLKFYKNLGVQKAFSTLEEYSIQDGYGTEGGFVAQMENPEEDDPSFKREYAVMKYIRNLWRVSDVLNTVATITNAELRAVQAAMRRSLRTTERNLFFGDSDKVPQVFDGLERTITNLGNSYQVIDLRGANITEANMKDAAEMITPNFGTPTEMYNSLSVQTTINNILGPSAQRINQEQIKAGGGVTMGHAVTGMVTPFGEFKFESSIFINPESQGVPMIKNASNTLVEGATSTKAPAMPTVSASAQGATVANSQWKTIGDGGTIAGLYTYRVVAINQYGKSQASVSVSATVVANGSITLTITAGAGGVPATAFEIYRNTIASSTDCYYTTTVKSGGTTTTYVDLNAYLAGTSKAFLVDNTTVGEERTMGLSQLAPIHKVEYAKIGPYRWGTVNFYVVPKFYAPYKMVEFVNVGVSRHIKSGILDL